jgi:hypothetical protein
MPEKEEDLILGNPADTEEGDVADWFEIREDARADIDTAIYVYQFLDEIDIDSPRVLQWNMKRRLNKVKRQCLEIICKSIDDLQTEREEGKDEEED